MLSTYSKALKVYKPSTVPYRDNLQHRLLTAPYLVSYIRKSLYRYSDFFRISSLNRSDCSPELPFFHIG